MGGGVSDQGALISAAEDYAKVYANDDREQITTDVLNAFYSGAAWAWKRSAPSPQKVAPGFRRELMSLINRHSKENGSDTPDFILADHLLASLAAFDHTTKLREAWYGRSLELVPTEIVPAGETK